MEKKVTMMHNNMHTGHYRRLIVMAVLSFIAMYLLMYSMVNTFSNVIPNINQFYMAAVMTMPMIIIELIVMSSMYRNKKLNAAVIGIAAAGLIVFFLLIRKQTAVSDRQFLRSMIPHHAGAILMCEQSQIKDPEIKKLCEAIRSGQEQEIREMKAGLAQLQHK
jgi:uncharacterized protein (DUF305 family)